MQEWEDIALLREYAERSSSEAFAELVRRHVNKVYSTALRCTGNRHQAEEIVQAVFVILAVKGPHLSRRVILSGWLYETARLTALTSVRSEIRRVHREKEAQMQSCLQQDESETWKRIGPLLDAALSALNEADRHAIVLRFFDGKTMRQVGDSLGAGEEAAKKRVSRALNKLQRFFLKHGAHSTSDLIAETISAHCAQEAPPSLAAAVTAAALSKGTASGSSASLAKGVLKIMAWSKTKAAIIGVIGILGASVATKVAVNRIEASPPVPGAPAVAAGVVFLGPPNPGAEIQSHGWYNWFSGARGAGFLYVDTIDPATGYGDFTLGNTEPGDFNRADWRSRKFKLGHAAEGGSPITFAFSYKLPEAVAPKDNLFVKLRFFDKTGTNLLSEETMLLGSASGDSKMTSYKHMVLRGLRAPQKGRVADIWITANRLAQPWTSGTARFDDFSVTTPQAGFFNGLFR